MKMKDNECKHEWRQVLFHIWSGSYNFDRIIEDHKVIFHCIKCLKLKCISLSEANKTRIE